MGKTLSFYGRRDAVPMVWIPEQKFACFVLNVTHLILPPGELWFCRVFNQVLPQIQNAKLQQEVKKFVAQEGAHARGHRRVLDAYEAAGWDFSVSKNRLNRIFEHLLGDKMLGRWRTKPAGRRRWLRMRVGMIAAIEHVTCVLGSWILENHSIAQAGADQRMLNLLLWHGAEEVEHRAVAFDLYRELGGGYWGRVFWFALAVCVIVLTWTRGTQAFIRQDQARCGNQSRFGFSAYVRASRDGFLPSVGFLMKSFLRYVRWGYHPSVEGNDLLAEATLKKLATGQ